MENLKDYISTPKMKYLDIKKTEYIQHLCEENFKTLMKVTKEELNEWRYSRFVSRKTVLSRCQFLTT